jgi:hypothetical protein
MSPNANDTLSIIIKLLADAEVSTVNLHKCLSNSYFVCSIVASGNILGKKTGFLINTSADNIKEDINFTIIMNKTKIVINIF